MATITIPSFNLAGKKTYLSVALGIAVILANHFLGISIPGVQLNDAEWMTNIWQLILVATGRSAMTAVSNSPAPSA